MKKILIFLILIIVFISCSTNEKEEEKPIIIENIEMLPSVNRTPRMSNFQVDIELLAKMNSNNLNQDIFYEWNVEQIKLDIQSNLSEIKKDNNNLKNSQKEEIKENKNEKKDINNKDLTEDKNSFDNSSDYEILNNISTLEKNETPTNCYLYISKNPLNCMLSIFEPGYYKITLRASNTKEIKEKSVIVKVGEPLFPELFLKLNIPDSYFNLEENKIDSTKSNNKLNDNSNDASNDILIKGKIYIKIDTLSQNKNNLSEFVKINGEDFKNGWYNTKIKINPFYSFKITAGTHIVKLEEDSFAIACLGKNTLPTGYDNIYFDFSDKKMNSITNSPIVLKNFEKNSIFSIYNKGTKKWKDGDIYLSYLLWGFNESKNNKMNEEFSFFENVLNDKNKVITTYFDNKFLAKIYIGSIGIKAKNNNFFIYFSPEGLETEEFDTKKERVFLGLPFGYLIGKLGNDGKEFPIGSAYTYLYSSNIKIFEMDKFGKYVEISDKEKFETKK